MHEVKKYTVIPLLNADGSKVLLLKKDRTAFAGMLNGIGGKIEDNETPEEGAYRELLEEAGLRPEDIERFTWLGTLTVPEQCDEVNQGKCPELWFFSGIVKDEGIPRKPDSSTEEIYWCMLGSDNHPFAPFKTAGDGDLEYFIGRARRLLFGNGAVSYE